MRRGGRGWRDRTSLEKELFALDTPMRRDGDHSRFWASRVVRIETVVLRANVRVVCMLRGNQTVECLRKKIERTMVFNWLELVKRRDAQTKQVIE